MNNMALANLGVAALFADSGNLNEFDVVLRLDDIEIESQVREEFEDEANSLAELGRSLRLRQLQAILVRPNRPGKEKPYLLVAGERRMRAARLEGLETLRVRVGDMSDEEAEDMQLAENIHRKNLTQIEAAKKIQRDLDQLGSVEAVLEKHNKSRAWLSKILSLLTLSEQARRVVQENVSADIEIINSVKTIEKADPAKAKALVDVLKETRGKENAREQVAIVKEQVKPSKRLDAKNGDVATPKNRKAEEPGRVSSFAPEKPGNSEAQALSETEILRSAYVSMSDGNSAKDVLGSMAATERQAAESWLQSFYDAGTGAKDVSRAVMLGLRSGQFASDYEGALALAAFLYGADREAKFRILDVLGSIKP